MFDIFTRNDTISFTGISIWNRITWFEHKFQLFLNHSLSHKNGLLLHFMYIFVFISFRTKDGSTKYHLLWRTFSHFLLFLHEFLHLYFNSKLPVQSYLPSERLQTNSFFLTFFASVITNVTQSVFSSNFVPLMKSLLKYFYFLFSFWPIWVEWAFGSSTCSWVWSTETPTSVYNSAGSLSNTFH